MRGRAMREGGGWLATPAQAVRRLLLGLSVLLAGCADHADLWRDAPYVVHWIDDPHAITLNYDLGEGASIGRVGAKVVAVGSNAQFIVAKQSTGGYFYIDRRRDHARLQGEAVVGPLSFQAFMLQKQALSLPPFTKAFERGALEDPS